MTVRGEGKQDWVPRTVSDTLDGDVSQSGAMRSLANLIFDPSTPNTFQCRPAVHLIDSMGTLGTSATVVTGALISDGTIYGMVTSTLNPGHDQPFAYDIADATFIPILGITAGNTPVSQPSSGDWIPPTMIELAGKVVVTHPGFTFPIAFGYIDISGFSASIIADTVSGSPILHGSFSTNGIGPGYLITGAGIPADTTVVDTSIVAISTTGTIPANFTINAIPTTAGFAAGQSIAGNGITLGSTIVSVPSGTSVTISQATGASAAGEPIFVTLATTGDTSTSNTITGIPSTAGMLAGQTVAGDGIIAGTTISAVNSSTQITLSAATTAATTGQEIFVAVDTTGTIPANFTINAIPTTVGMAVGQEVAGVGVPTGATISNVSSGTSIALSAATTQSTSNQDIFVTGNTITMSQDATATANGITIAVAGGTADSPLWAAGNTTQNQLAGVARTVNSFNNRFYFSVGNAESYTDTLSLSMVTSTQTLFIGDSSPIVAVAQMPLSTTSQAVIAGLMVYKENNINQITGDPVTTNLAISEVSPTVGTDSPRSIINTPDGQMFKAVDGMRLIEFTGLLSEPDPDLAVPFIYAQFPSRVSAGYNTNIYRICLQNENVDGIPYQEYWFDLKNAGWTGPHSFPQDLALPYKSTFILFSNQFAPGMYQSDVVLNQGGNIDNFVEFGVTDLVAEDGITLLIAEDGATQLVSENNLQFVFLVDQDGLTNLVAEDGITLLIAEDAVGVPISWEYQTVPMTDSGNFYANCLLNSTIEISIPQEGNPVQFTAYDEGFNQLNQVFIQEAFSAPIWGQFIWGLAKWGATTTGLQPTSIPWSTPFEYNRLSVDISGISSGALKIGTLHVEGRALSYIRR